MKTHYHPNCINWDEIDVATCGVFLGESSYLSWDWDRVTCLRCLNGRVRIETAIQVEESAIVEQMGDTANFMSLEARR